MIFLKWIRRRADKIGMDVYCPYCTAYLTDDTYGCGTRVGGERTRKCLESEIMILRAEKEHAFQQTYDLEWQRNLYAGVAEAAKPLVANGEITGAVADAVHAMDRLSLPFCDRDDDLTRDFIARRAARQARIKD